MGRTTVEDPNMRAERGDYGPSYGRGEYGESMHASDSVLARKASRAGLGLQLFAIAIALVWVAAVGVGAFILLGEAGLLALLPAQQAGLAIAAVLPSLLVVFCGMAAREGARARAEARRLADAADRMLNPSPSARTAANRVGLAVREEIDQLDRALEGVVMKLRETESQVARQTAAVTAAADTAKAGALHMITGMERERDTLLQIATDLNAQASLIGDQVSRHARVIADAARLAESDVRTADSLLEQRLSSFTAATSLIGDRTHALHSAAAASSDSALRLETALSNALDVLAKASSLTDAARQNAELAVRAADSTSGAVRDTTARAIDEAKHAADLIRAEALAMEREAARAMERLREAADSARTAGAARTVEPPPLSRPASAPVAAEGPVRARTVDAQPSQEWRGPRPANLDDGGPRRSGVAPLEDLDRAWTDLERGGGAAPSGGPMALRGDPGRADLRASNAPPTPASRLERKPSFGEQLAGTAFARPAATPNERERARDIPTFDATPPAPQPKKQGGGWRWRDMLASIDREDRRAASKVTVAATPNGLDPAKTSAPAPAPTQPTVGASLSAQGVSQSTLVSFARHPLPIVNVLEGVGLRLSDVFAPTALERIAQRARNGTQARRRAVIEAAPDAVARLEIALRADAGARAESGAFLRSEGARIAELLGRGRAAMTADATRAFLLLDAASS